MSSTKRISKGKSAEYLLLSILTSRGHVVSVPSMDCSYDLLTDNGHNLIKIQVKSTDVKHPRGGYAFNISKSRRKRYKEGELDLFAFFIGPLDIWYIIPYDKINVSTLHLYPNSKNTKFVEYKNNMEIFDL